MESYRWQITANTLSEQGRSWTENWEWKANYG